MLDHVKPKNLLLVAGCLLSAALAAWEPPFQLTSDANPALIPAGNAKALAACDSGVLQAVWFDGRNGPYNIYGKRSTDYGLTWEDDENLSQDPDTAGGPSVVGNGSLLHLMYRAHRGDWRLCYRRSTDAGATWPAEVYLDSGLSMAGGNVSNAAAGEYVHAMWPTWVSANNSEIFYRRSTDQGATWLPKVRLTVDSARSEDPCVAVCGPCVHLAWFDTRTGGQNSFYKRSTDNGETWGPDVQMTNDSGLSYFPMVAATDAAVHFARWARRNGELHILYRRSTDNGANWGPDVQIDSGSQAASGPVLFADGNTIHVAWDDRRSGTSQLYDRHSTDGGMNWSKEDTLTFSPSNSGGPAFASVDSLLNITYTNDSGGARQVWYLRNPGWNVGTSESHRPQATSSNFEPTIIRGILLLPRDMTALADRGRGGQTAAVSDRVPTPVLLDISGRKVLDLHAGQNNVSGLAPGVYFIRWVPNVERGASSVERTSKVILSE
jgi:hypothetical protein